MLLIVQLNSTILAFSDIKSIVCRLSSTLTQYAPTLDCLKPVREMQFLLGSYSPSIMPMIYWSMFFNVSFLPEKERFNKLKLVSDIYCLAMVQLKNRLNSKMEKRTASRNQTFGIIRLGCSMFVNSKLVTRFWLDQCGTNIRY